MPERHPQFLTDPDGKRLAIPLPIAEYEALLRYLAELEARTNADH